MGRVARCFHAWSVEADDERLRRVLLNNWCFISLEYWLAGVSHRNTELPRPVRDGFRHRKTLLATKLIVHTGGNFFYLYYIDTWCNIKLIQVSFSFTNIFSSKFPTIQNSYFSSIKYAAHHIQNILLLPHKCVTQHAKFWLVFKKKKKRIRRTNTLTSASQKIISHDIQNTDSLFLHQIHQSHLKHFFLSIK